jgi:hypothetical protein
MDEFWPDDKEEPTSGCNEYRSHGDRRKRAKERLLTSPHVSDDILGESQRHGKAHQVQFKISPFAQKVGEEIAALFNLSLSQYCKALLYLNLGLVGERLDRRRRPRKVK